MIYPNRRAILAAAAIAPLTLVIGVAVPQYWFAGLALLVFLLALCAADALLNARASKVELLCDGPGSVSVGADFEVEAHVRFPFPAPAFAEVAIGTDHLLSAPQGSVRRIALSGGSGSGAFAFTALRRGTAHLGTAWLRWPGMLGLVWKQKKLTLGQEILISPDIRPVREKAAQLLHRDAMHGLVVQQQLGESSEFEALTDFRAGMDRRSIDWKQSARHTALLAKEHRTERNNNIIMAVDAGRAMCEPLAGVPRVDRAVSAALLTSYVALKEGDRVGFFGFDSHPRVSSNTVSGPRSFALLQRVAAGIDYSANETNYTLALATLGTGLNRRSLIVVFTDFADTISAEFMLAAVGPLLKRHLVLFVVMRDEELEAFASVEPTEPEDVSRAVTAAALLRQRKLVIARLRHLGVQVIEAPHDQVGPSLVNAYVALKRKSLL